ncbi:MAG: transcription termination/antitermination protein NusG, partial [Dehalococcoidia bacterium]
LKCDAESEGMPSLARGAHVYGWVAFGGIVPALPDDFVDQMMQRLEVINLKGGLWRRFHRGEKVRVVSGGLQNLAEVVEEAKSPHARVRVLMEFMGRAVSTHVPWENLQSIDEEPEERHRVPRRTRGRGRWITGFGSRAAVAR